MNSLYPRSFYTLLVKRPIDFVLAIIGLVIVLPIILLIAFLIKFGSPGPIFYRGVRAGRYGIPFRIFKFRTMVVNAEKIGGPSTALNDPRLTPVGKFLRKYKLDELPQLFNIISGEMSFVGPRPQVEKYTNLYKGEETIILHVRPGLTDYASIHLIHLDALLGDKNVDEKYITEIEPLKNKLRIKYVKEISLWVDVKIFFLTIVQLFKIKAKWNTSN